MLAEGQIIGNYRIVRKIGEGGMGAVFEAMNPDIGRRAAVKVLHPQFAQNAQVATRFLNEAKAANRIEHPGVVEIYEFSRLPDGTTYIVMEFLKGESLAKRLERGPLGLDTLRIARQVASVLAAAHDHGIIHRDLKPDNVYIVKDPEAPGGERAKVLDFGIAKIAEEQTMKTQAGSILGTPAYMAPEQCRGASGVTDKSDVYALGIMMYEMLSGRVPFVGEGVGEIMIAHITQEPAALREVMPSVPGDLAAYVHRMLSKDGPSRPSMKEVIDQLEHFGAVRTGVLQAVVDQSARISLAPPPATPSLHATPENRTLLATAEPPAASRPRTLALSDSENPPPAIPPPPGQPATADARRRLLLAGGLGGLLLGIGAVILLLFRGPKPAPRRPSPDLGVVADGGSHSGPGKKHNEPRKPKVPPPPGTVFVPGGRFDMGSSQGEIDAALKLCSERGTACQRSLYERELPRRSVTVRDLFVDQTEVNNTQFAEWLNEQPGLKLQKKRVVSLGKSPLLDIGDSRSGIEWSRAKLGGFKVRAGFAERPAVQLSWTAAQRFCQAKGKRLPTEAEWELAARGAERRTFPWGEDSPSCSGVVFGREPSLTADRRCPGDSLPAPVGSSTQDRTPLGVHDLGGNVAEWVQDRFSDHYSDCGSCKNPLNDEAPGDAGSPTAQGKKAGKAGKRGKGKGEAATLRVVRGGHLDLPADGCRSAGRSRLGEDQMTFRLGFRCVRSLSE